MKGVQLYKCIACGKQFRNQKTAIDVKQLWQDYTQGKQTYSQLAQQYACSVKTIQRKLDSVKPEKSSTFSAVVNVVMDTTYFGKTFGVMVFKDSLQGQILLTKYVKQETNKLYIEGIEEIGRRRITIQAIICNGRKGGFTTI